MDLSVRGVNPVAMKLLDETAKRKKVSRSEYVRQMIEGQAVLDAIASTEDRYEKLVQSVLLVLVENTAALEQVRSVLLKGEIHGE